GGLQSLLHDGAAYDTAEEAKERVERQLTRFLQELASSHREQGNGGPGYARNTGMEELREIAAKLETIEGARTWIAEKASEPDVRVYFGGDSYVAVTPEQDDMYGIEFVPGDGLSFKKRQRFRELYTRKVESALGVEIQSQTPNPRDPG